jgi:hypothetical protein
MQAMADRFVGKFMKAIFSLALRDYQYRRQVYLINGIEDARASSTYGWTR